MDAEAVGKYLREHFEGVEPLTAAGYTFYFYGPDRMMPFATMITEDNDYDRFSNLDRPGVFRLNIGLKRETYQSLLGPQPTVLNENGVIDTDDDFTALDKLMPHPNYAPQSWVCILSPSAESWESIKSLLDEAYGLAVKRHERREHRATNA